MAESESAGSNAVWAVVVLVLVGVIVWLLVAGPLSGGGDADAPGDVDVEVEVPEVPATN